MRHRLRSIATCLRDDQRGLETVEYAILTGLIAAGTIAAIVSISLWAWVQFRQLFYDIASQDAT